MSHPGPLESLSPGPLPCLLGEPAPAIFGLALPELLQVERWHPPGHPIEQD